MEQSPAMTQMIRHGGRKAEARQVADALDRNAGMMVVYPDNIMAACQAANRVSQKSEAAVVKNKVDLEKRRKANRLNAQRWRKRKSIKCSSLHEQIRALQNEQEGLKFENARLQAELQTEVALARAEAAHLASYLLSARLSSLHPSLSGRLVSRGIQNMSRHFGASANMQAPQQQYAAFRFPVLHQIQPSLPTERFPQTRSCQQAL